jgi:arrestin-related trafficking adapter 3/6
VSLDTDTPVRSRQDSTISIKDTRKLALQHGRSRSLGKGDTISVASTKGYRIFTPGEYVYNFELPIDSRMPESINVELGSVKYDLEAIIERAGAFRANLMGSKEVTLIRSPAENSLETVEPIAISRDWEDQLHYDIVISGKSFPLGSQIPIAFKLTPLAKVQCHRIKVYVTENIQYFTANKRVHRLEPTRKIQLFEKRADGPSTSAFSGSTVRVVSGGGVAYDHRVAAAAGDENVDRDMTNLLGNLEGEHNVGPTEMELNVQLPSCHQMEKEKAGRIHFDTTYANIQVNHWIKIVLRLSRPDSNDPAKRRHFEISIDSPFNILSCRATQANTSLPAYSTPDSSLMLIEPTECGCPGAPRVQRQGTGPSGLARTMTNSSSSPSPQESSVDLPRQDSGDSAGSNPIPRPMHLLRHPSFNPPAFSDDDPPPPLVTPPPRYEPETDGDPLEDYFARLAEAMDRNELPMTPGRVEVPLTPGGRTNRSMDEQRTWLSVGGNAAVGA